MDAKKRWTLLLLALAATVAAVAFPAAEDENLVEVVIPASRTRQSVSQTAAPPAASPEIAWVASDEDPFAERGWQAPPPPPEPSKQPVAAAPVDTTPPPPPPLPYKFVGQMNNGNERTVYLARGDQVVLAQQGDVLDGSYKVAVIRPSVIEFESVSSGLKQTLAIPAQEN
ncbi:hypothetical protein [Pseudoduganella sp.]|uniref:hypothetical protein n=1 Tax=Pseudoduganella sp. TaxID=1880898 RepID=UPI0035AF5AB8